MCIYFDQYKALPDAQKRKLANKFHPINLFFETCNYNIWFENEESSDTARKKEKEESVDLSNMPPIEGGKEVKQAKEIKILTPNKLLNRLSILLVKIKLRNNSKKLKNEMY